MSILVCPLCSTGLARAGERFVCDNSHSFDISKEGYVNLLAASGRASRLKGDVREMLQSRRRLLATGVYDALADRIATIAADTLDPIAEKGGVVVDAGCGEGHYLRRLRELWMQSEGEAANGEHLLWYGFDISKDAIKMAARADIATQYCIHDIYNPMPLRDDSVSVLLNIFAPRNFREFARILRPDGVCLVAMPAPEHLQELREYFTMVQVDPRKEERVQDEALNYFDMQDRISIARTVLLSPSAAADAVGMGPSYWHAEQETNAAIIPHENVQVTVSMLLYVLRPSL